MFELGNFLKNTREQVGVSIEEAAEDINIKKSILENIESGTMGCFKDIYELKDYIRNYAKYLGLDEEQILDDFNEYMFEYTSKIPLKEIEKQVMEQQKEKVNEGVASPYSKPKTGKSQKYFIVLYIGIIVVVILIVVWVIVQIFSAKFL